MDQNSDMYFNLYGKNYYFQQTGFSQVTMNSMRIGIGCTHVFLHYTQTTTYASSTQIHKLLTYNGVGGPGSYSQKYSMYCSYEVIASEFDAIRDAQI